MDKENKVHTPKGRVGMNMAGGEKAKDFKKAIKRLFKELGGYKALIMIAIILAFLSSVLSILSPNKLSDLTNEISKGLGTQFHPKWGKIMLQLIAQDTSYTMHQ